ncbi:hypothetical protein [Maricaulis parjimensis]|uniref:hypothetical protein n=1 Tax=Maricaulis parjimensis TaxID=144023 RepID=UPI0019397A3A|nr:hypothetical protein [Maricaulis parjimensis]
MSSWKTISRASLALALWGSAAFAQEGIEVERLDALDPLEVSLPRAALDNRLWSATGRDQAVAVLSRLPDPEDGEYRSETLASVARTLLISGGQPPAGGRGDTELARLRVERLLAAAGAGDAFDLLERTPGVNRQPVLARWHADLGFATGELESACRTADALIEGRDTAYWLRVRAFCLSLQGQSAAAELTAELARSQSADDGFDARLFALTLDTPLPANTPAAETALQWAMDHRLEAGVGMADTAPSWLKEVAHEAEGRSQPPATDPQLAFETALDQSGRDRHHTLEAVLAQGRDRELAGQALGLLLADAGGGARFVHVARHHGREIQTIPVTAATLEHGYEIAMAALLVGDLRSAWTWRNALLDGPPRPEQPVLVPQGLSDEDKPAGEPDIMSALPEEDWVPPSPARMVALDLALAVAEDEMQGGSYEAVQAAWLEGRGASVLAQAAALERLGAPSPAGLREALLAADPMPAPAGLAALDAAVRAGARGEAAMLAVSLLNQDGAADNPDVLARTLGALDAVGLRRHARVLLLEQIILGAM